MILATHLVFSCYGFWPPNDDRGSWPARVWAKHLQPLGEAKKVTVGHSIAHHPHDREKNRAIRDALQYPVVRLDAPQRACVAAGIAEAVDRIDIAVHACAIMPDHVHLIVAPHHQTVEYLSGFFKRCATKHLTRAGLHPLEGYANSRRQTPTPWVRGEWKRFIFDVKGVQDRIVYVENNPVQIGLPKQEHSFVKPFTRSPV